MAIPKIIHYVWVGGNPKSKDIERCMRTWKKHLKDYEIIEWNEDNFDINSNEFVRQAYEAKKWAYVSDYIRAYAIYHYGGIYLDTDVLVLDDLEDLLQNKAFVGYENPQYPFTAVFGAEKNHPFLKSILDYYKNLSFEFDVNDQYKNVNTKTVSDILIEDYACELGNKEQLLRTGIKVYKDNVLCNPSKYSKTIHIFTGTWLEGQSNFAKNINRIVRLRLTTKNRAKLYSYYRNSK
ncbi:MAG: glycosyltransferase [Peptostreptococcaceae bacterium]